MVGGHSGVTILPLLSQTGVQLTPAEIEALTKRIQFGGDEVVKVFDYLILGKRRIWVFYVNSSSATLSMALAGEIDVIKRCPIRRKFD